MPKSTHLVIDQGNTTTKIGVFNGKELIKSQRLKDNEWSSFLDQKDLPSQGIFSTVRAHFYTPKEFTSLSEKLVKMHVGISMPISIAYDTPETLGHDRIANAVGATVLFPHQYLLIIDCGTCITTTFVQNNQIVGGSISLGLGLRLKATHEYTGKLPLLEMNELLTEIPLVGKNTRSSIASGIVHGALSEVGQMIEKYCSLFPDINVILTGGDASFFASRLKYTIFAEPNLTLRGLNEIFICTAH